MSIIRCRDRLAACGRRIWSVKDIVAAILLIVAMLVAIAALSGCGRGSMLSYFGLGQTLPRSPTIPAAQPFTLATVPGESAEEHAIRVLNHRIDDLDGERLKLEREKGEAEKVRDLKAREALVAPIRASLVIAAWIGGLAVLAGAALVVASFIWAMAIGWKGGATVAAMGAVVLAGSLALLFAISAAVAHPWWTMAVVGGAGLLCAFAVYLGIHYMRHQGAVAAETTQVGQDAMAELERLGHGKLVEGIKAAAAKRQDAVRGMRAGVRRLREHLGMRKAA